MANVANVANVIVTLTAEKFLIFWTKIISGKHLIRTKSSGYFEAMGNSFDHPVNVPNPADIKGPHCKKDPSYDPNFGFPSGRKERGLLIKDIFFSQIMRLVIERFLDFI